MGAEKKECYYYLEIGICFLCTNCQYGCEFFDYFPPNIYYKNISVYLLSTDTSYNYYHSDIIYHEFTHLLGEHHSQCCKIY